MIKRILFFLIFSSILLASGDVRELEKKLETASPREQFEILIELARHSSDRFPRKSIEYATRALRLSRQLKNKSYEGLALQKIGTGYNRSDRHKKALDYHYRAQRIFESIDDKKYLAVLWRKMGNAFTRLSDYKNALAYYDRGLGYFEKTGDRKAIADFLNNKGLVYYYWGKLDGALENFLGALKIAETSGTSKRSEAIYNGNLGRTYGRLGDYDKALHHLHRGLSVIKGGPETQIIISIHIEIARVYKDQGKFDTAVDYCNKSLRIMDSDVHKRLNGDALLLLAEIHTNRERFQKALNCARRALKNYREIGSNDRISSSLTLMGHIRKEMGQFPEALEDLKQGAEIARQLNLLDALQNCYLDLSEIFSAMGDSDQSLRYYKMYNEVKEKIFNKVTTSRIRNTQVKYETQKMHKEIEGVKTSKQTVFLFFSGVVLVLGLVLALVLYNRRRIKKRAQILLEQKDREIEFHKKTAGSLKEQIKAFLSQKDRKRYEASNLTPEQQEIYLRKLLRYMKAEKPYLDSELTLKRLAGGLSVSYRELSQVINERTGMHFHDFVNRYRVEESKRMLRESILKDEMSILGIAYEVGFNSKSSFNTAFKKAAGITPSQYRKACLRSSSPAGGAYMRNATN